MNEFVTAYNELVDYVDAQSQFDSDTGEAGLLLGNQSTSAVLAEIQQAIVGIVDHWNLGARRA